MCPNNHCTEREQHDRGDRRAGQHEQMGEYCADHDGHEQRPAETGGGRQNDRDATEHLQGAGEIAEPLPSPICSKIWTIIGTP